MHDPLIFGHPVRRRAIAGHARPSFSGWEREGRASPRPPGSSSCSRLSDAARAGRSSRRALVERLRLARIADQRGGASAAAVAHGRRAVAALRDQRCSSRVFVFWTHRANIAAAAQRRGASVRRKGGRRSGPNAIVPIALVVAARDRRRGEVRLMRCAVIGAGAWGTALADLLAGERARPMIWAYEPDVASRSMKRTRIRDSPRVRARSRSLRATTTRRRGRRGGADRRTRRRRTICGASPREARDVRRCAARCCRRDQGNRARDARAHDDVVAEEVAWASGRRRCRGRASRPRWRRASRRRSSRRALHRRRGAHGAGRR